ncbi:MAG: 4'-phosphopantetheinyl transferase superfamily protein [Luteolibacter sp.]
MKIHLIHPGKISREEAIRHLTPDELERAAKFRFEKDANHWIACRAELRRLLTEALGAPTSARSIAHGADVNIGSPLPLATTSFGKPLLAAPYDFLHFNLSHCPDLALLAISEKGPIGIDIEPISRASGLPECASSFCHPREIETQPDAIKLLEIWTAKEAVLKALGTGLSIAPETIRIENNRAFSDTPVPGLENFEIQRLETQIPAGYRAAVAIASIRAISFT